MVFFSLPVTFSNMKEMSDALEAFVQGREGMREKLEFMTSVAKEHMNRTIVAACISSQLSSTPVLSTI